MHFSHSQDSPSPTEPTRAVDDTFFSINRLPFWKIAPRVFVPPPSIPIIV